MAENIETILEFAKVLEERKFKKTSSKIKELIKNNKYKNQTFKSIYNDLLDLFQEECAKGYGKDNQENIQNLIGFHIKYNRPEFSKKVKEFLGKNRTETSNYIRTYIEFVLKSIERLNIEFRILYLCSAFLFFYEIIFNEIKIFCIERKHIPKTERLNYTKLKSKIFREEFETLRNRIAHGRFKIINNSLYTYPKGKNEKTVIFTNNDLINKIIVLDFFYHTFLLSILFMALIDRFRAIHSKTSSKSRVK